MYELLRPFPLVKVAIGYQCEDNLFKYYMIIIIYHIIIVELICRFYQ